VRSMPGRPGVEQLFTGVFRAPDPKNPNKRLIATKNLTPGRSYYGERLSKVQFEGQDFELRFWDPFRSKLSASILNGLGLFPFKEGSNCLYLGASTGTTVSHISDVVGNSGRIFAVELAARVARELMENVVRYRNNIIPIIADASKPQDYPSIYGNISIAYCDIAQSNQTEIAVSNCSIYLADQRESFLFLVVKASSIDVLKPKIEVFRNQSDLLQRSGFTVRQVIDLEPFDRNHAMIVASMG